MSLMVSDLLEELNGIKIATNGIDVMSQNIGFYELSRDKKNAEAHKKADAELKEKYPSIYSATVKNPFPSVDFNKSPNPPAKKPLYLDAINFSKILGEDNNAKNWFALYLGNFLSRFAMVIAIVLALGGALLGAIVKFLRFLPMLGSSLFCVGIIGYIVFQLLMQKRIKNSADVYKNALKAIDYMESYKKYEKEKKNWYEHTEKHINDIVFANYSEGIDRLLEKNEVFKQDYKTFAARFKDENKPILDAYKANIRENEEEYQALCEEANKKIAVCREFLDSVTILHPKMFSKADKIYTVIESGRADSIKEAINIVLSDERLDREEEERRNEAMRQQRVLEQQAEENRRHNNEMKLLAEKENNARKDAASKRCKHCARLNSCSYSVRNSFTSTGDVCSAYIPKK